MTPIVYLVSGANRSIGLGLVTALARRDEVIVFAGAQNPSAAAELHALAQRYPEKVYIVKLTSCNKAENEAAVEEIKSIAGRLDVVIANAGIFQYFAPVSETPAEQMRNHFEINVVGTMILFQAAYPLLKASTPSPKFIPISSRAGSITTGTALPAGIVTYGSSKAAENYLARKLHFENDGLICFPMCPGGVDTDMSANVIKQNEQLRSHIRISVEDSVQGVLNQIDHATREMIGGTFVSYDGEKLDW